MKKYRTFLFVVFGFIFAGCFGFGLLNSAVCQQAKTQDESESLAKLKSTEAKIRENGATEIVQARKKLVAALLAQAGLKEDKVRIRGSKELAIETLGELRAIEAVPFLIKHVNYHVTRISFERNPIAGYPCAYALTKIGSPAFPQIWERFRHPLNDLEISLFAYVIRRSDGEEIGQTRIELARKQADNIGTVDGDVARKNLDRLLEHYKTKKTGF